MHLATTNVQHKTPPSNNIESNKEHHILVSTQYINGVCNSDSKCNL